MFGDIHGDPGFIPLAEELLETGVKLVFLGDYVDRGPESQRVWSWIREHLGEIVALRGNHEADGYMGSIGPSDPLWDRLPLFHEDRGFLAVHGILPVDGIEAWREGRIEDWLEDNWWVVLWYSPDPEVNWMRGLPPRAGTDPDEINRLLDRSLLRGHDPFLLPGGIWGKIITLSGSELYGIRLAVVEDSVRLVEGRRWKEVYRELRL